MKIKIGIDLSLMRYGNLQNETPMNILFSAIDFKTMTLNYNHSSSGNKLFYINGTWDRHNGKGITVLKIWVADDSINSDW